MVEAVLDFVLQLLTRLWHIFIRSWMSQEGLWMVLPLIFILVFIHLYFGRYRSEELGWNSAFGNSISLFWISIILFRFLFENYGWRELVYGARLDSLIVVSFLTFWVLLLFIFNFFHVLPKKLAFLVSSASSVYILAYIVISLVVGEFTLDKITLLSSFILFILLLLLLQLIKHLIPMTSSAKQVLKKREEKKNRKKGGKKAARKKKIDIFKEKLKKKVKGK